MTLKTMNLATMISAGLLMIFSLMKENNSTKMLEKTSFECGFMAHGPKKSVFSTNFITMIMLFIMFDIEVSIMIPMLMKSTTTAWEVLIPMSFLLGLTLILLKEWLIGSMEWTK